MTAAQQLCAGIWHSIASSFGSAEDWHKRQGNQGCRGGLTADSSGKLPGYPVCPQPLHLQNSSSRSTGSAVGGGLGFPQRDFPWLQCLPQSHFPRSMASNTLPAPGAAPQLPEGINSTCPSVPWHLHPQSPLGVREGIHANSKLSRWNCWFQ